MVLSPHQAAPPAPDRAAARSRRPAARGEERPRLADGVDLIGESLGSGFKETPYLARRADGQTLQLTKLLHLVAEEVDGHRSYAEIAAAVSDRFGRRVSAGNVHTLVDDKLRPLGLVAGPDGEQPVLTKPDPLLALKLRKGVLPPRVVRALTTLCYPLFFAPVVVAAVVAVLAMDWYVFVHHGVAQSVRQTVLNPALFFAMFGLVVVSAFFHECGHATGCRYSGAEPGVMGVGLYLVFPAFYTDVTDAYRLGKAGKLRTDLGGIYFNALFMLATFGGYLATGFEPLLFMIMVQHIEIAHQLLPFLRLDGYYVVADLVGVPDLFARVKPILRSMLPGGRKDDPRVAALKPWVRVVVTAWVLVVVPFLGLQLFLLLVHLPRFVGTGVESMGRQWDSTSGALTHGDMLGVASGAVQLGALSLPLLGVGYTLARVGQRVSRRAWTWSAESVWKRLALGTAVLVAGALLVRAWLPGDGRYRPIGPDERGTVVDSVASVLTTRGTLVDRPTGDPARPGPTPTPGSGDPTGGTGTTSPTPAGTGDPTTDGTTTASPGTQTSSAEPTPSPAATGTATTPASASAEPSPTGTSSSASPTSSP